MNLLLLKNTQRAVVRLCTLPNSHPLHDIVHQAATSKPAKHLTPIDNLDGLFHLDPKNTESIIPTAQSPYHIQKFKVTTADTREESIELEKNNKADYRIYTDGSGIEGNTGAVAVMYKKGRKTLIKSLQYYLGPKEDHNSYEAELIGGILGVWLAESSPETRGKTVLLYTDNQSLLQAVTKIGSKSGQHLVKALEDLANNAKCKLTFNWISGHRKVEGNEKVDKLAKQAADHKSSRIKHLPPKLRKTISVSALKEKYHKSLLAEWEESWSNSPRKARVEEIDNLFPFSRYRKNQQKLTRDQASKMIQVVIGTGLQTCACSAVGLQGYMYGYEISTLAKPIPLVTGIRVGGMENFKYII